MDAVNWAIPVIAGLFLALLLLERWFPLRRLNVSWMARILVNLLFIALAYLAAAFLVRPVVSTMLNLNENQSFGLVHWFALPSWGKGICAFLLMDLSFYYWHRLNHRIPFLWRFHNVHHIDPDLDVTTGFRFHFGEIALSSLFRVVQLSVIGISVWSYAVYEFVFQANTLFHHSNVRLPIRWERSLNRILVTPRMHGIHHSQVEQETNSNYSVIFPWWDRIHRTLGLNIPQTEIQIGVPGYNQPEDNRFWRVLTMPFRKQRSYWIRPDGNQIRRDPSRLQGKRNQLAE